MRGRCSPIFSLSSSIFPFACWFLSVPRRTAAAAQRSLNRLRPSTGANTQACTGKLVFEGKLDEPNRGDVLFENLDGEAACYEPMSSVKGSAIQYCLLVLEREGDVGAISSSMLVGNCGTAK